MIVDEIGYIDQDHPWDLLQRVRDSVFHITSEDAFDQIRADGFVRHNKDQKFALNAASENSFGRNRGWVCLFDLRNRSEATIEETLIRHNFLEPSWFTRHHPDYTESRLAYLFVAPEAYGEIVPSETAKRAWTQTNRHEQYVPETECWYPGDMPLNNVERALIVTICKSAPKDNPFLYAHHRRAVEGERKKSSGRSAGLAESRD